MMPVKERYTSSTFRLLVRDIIAQFIVKHKRAPHHLHVDALAFDQLRAELIVIGKVLPGAELKIYEGLRVSVVVGQKNFTLEVC